MENICGESGGLTATICHGPDGIAVDQMIIELQDAGLVVHLENISGVLRMSERGSYA